MAPTRPRPTMPTTEAPDTPTAAEKLAAIRPPVTATPRPTGPVINHHAMTVPTFARAEKRKSKLRLAICGPSGSGKTYTALRIAAGIGGRIAVIDTEHGSAQLYADRFAFDCCDLTEHSVAMYMASIKAAAAAGYDVLVLDSVSHAWYALLDWVDAKASASRSGNTFQAWAKGSPIQREFVEAILGYPGHVIATMRTKTEWVVELNAQGKNAPRKVGLAPVQGKDIEYEFSLLLEMSPDHVGTITKDRTGKYQDQSIDKPGEEFGAALAAWLNEGAE